MLQAIEKIKSSGKALKTYQEQLRSLDQISQRISENPLLQTDLILDQTRNILSVIKRRDVGYLLEKGRVYRSWAFILKERSLIEHSNTLEILKATLILSIQERHSITLHNIDVNTSNTPASNPASERLPDMDSCYGSGESDSESGRNAPMDSSHSPKTASTEPTRASEPQNDQSLPPNETPSAQTCSKFTGNKAGRDTNQTNGIAYAAGISHQPGSKIDFSGHHYEANTKVAGPGGMQCNGVDMVFPGSMACLPKMNGGEWRNNEVTDSPDTSNNAEGQTTSGGPRNEPMATQVNGYNVRAPISKSDQS